MCALAGLAAACSPRTPAQTPVDRGDIAFARDSLDEALAEYRLAVRQGDDDPATLARVAHTYIRLGRVNEASDFYSRATEADPSLADQAATDLVELARAAAERNDRFQMASAMVAALDFKPGLGVQEMALPLARHYVSAGEYGRALPFYQNALAAVGDSVPELVFEIGLAHEEIGDCRRALVYFERFRAMVRPWERGEVDWYIGNCSFSEARERRAAADEMWEDLRRRGLVGRRPSVPDRGRRRSFQERRGRERVDPERTGDPTVISPDTALPTPAGEMPVTPEARIALLEDALRYVDRTLEVGEPRNLLGQAWFERGDILSALGECDAALEAFRRVREVEPGETTALARRAVTRYDEIRFGRGLRELNLSDRCG